MNENRVDSVWQHVELQEKCLNNHLKSIPCAFKILHHFLRKNKSINRASVHLLNKQHSSFGAENIVEVFSCKEY